MMAPTPRNRRSAKTGARRVPVDPFRALRTTNYKIFAVGFLLGGLGLQMLSTAVLWEIWERTHDPLWLGYSGLARAIPLIAFALFGGHLADVVSRRAVVIVTQSVFAITGVAFAVTAYLAAPPWILLVLLALSGAIRAFNGPSRSSLLPLLIPRSRFENAVTWNSGIFQGSAIVGPILATGIIMYFGRTEVVYLISALLCACFACSAVMLRPRNEPRSATSLSPRAMFGGMHHIVREKTILGALTLDMLAVLFGGATALLPVFADTILNAGPMAYGALRAAPNVGAIVIAMWLAVRPRIAPAGALLLGSVALFGLCMIGFGLSQSLVLSLILLALSGAADNVSVVIRQVLVQTRTPNHLRGRVSAMNNVFIECSNELGAFESGLLARLVSPVFSVVAGGVGTLLVVGFVARTFPALRKLQGLRESAPLSGVDDAPLASSAAR